MSKADIVYDQVVENILANGISDEGENVRPKWADGTPAHTISTISEKMVFDGTEVPILTKKKVAWKAAIHELLWFYVLRTSDVTYLRENNVKIWEEWTREPNAIFPYPNIGKSYGYQLGKPISSDGIIDLGKYTVEPGKTNQVYKILDGLQNRPASRRHLISLWNIDELHEAPLPSCVWNSQWLVKKGVLHGIVQQRSADMGIGNPFNVFQYYVLQRMLAQVTGYKVGTLTFNIGDAHIYDRHIDSLKDQLTLPSYQTPKLWINSSIKDFDAFTIGDFILVHPDTPEDIMDHPDRCYAEKYAWYEHGPTIKMEVAI